MHGFDLRAINENKQTSQSASALTFFLALGQTKILTIVTMRNY
jgi:hypothetical protein